MSDSLRNDRVTGNNNNGGLFGNGDGSWWIIILFLFIFAGWNNNGGWGNNGAGGISENYTLISDMGQIERKIDTVNNGLCDGFYSTAQLINGVNMQAANNTAAMQQTMVQGFSGLNTGMVQNGYETRLGIQNIGTQMQQCCCDIREGIAGVNYNLANQANGITNAVNTGFCQTNFNGQQNTRDIIDSQNANTRAILDAIQQNKVEALKDRIAEQNQQISALNLAASQTAQNAYLIDKLGQKCPIPAQIYTASVPVNFNNGCNGCGCGC